MLARMVSHSGLAPVSLIPLGGLFDELCCVCTSTPFLLHTDHSVSTKAPHMRREGWANTTLGAWSSFSLLWCQVIGISSVSAEG